MGLSYNMSSTQQINTLIVFLCWHDRPFLLYNILVFWFVLTDCQALIYVLYVYAWF